MRIVWKEQCWSKENAKKTQMQCARTTTDSKADRPQRERERKKGRPPFAPDPPHLPLFSLPVPYQKILTYIKPRTLPQDAHGRAAFTHILTGCCSLFQYREYESTMLLFFYCVYRTYIHRVWQRFQRYAWYDATYFLREKWMDRKCTGKHARGETT
jgi:hypothetical protein